MLIIIIIIIIITVIRLPSRIRGQYLPSTTQTLVSRLSCALVLFILGLSGCWFVDGDILTAALHVLQFQLLPPPPPPLAPIKSRMETFWYQLKHVHLENGR